MSSTPRSTTPDPYFDFDNDSRPLFRDVGPDPYFGRARRSMIVRSAAFAAQFARDLARIVCMRTMFVANELCRFSWLAREGSVR